MHARGAAEPWSVEFPLRGPAGEPVDLPRAFRSHGLTALPPMRLDEGVFEVTLSVEGHGPRTVRVSEGRSGYGVVSAAGPPVGWEEGERLLAAVKYVLRLDEDLSPFYALAVEDPELAWVTGGAGRMVRGTSVFEEVVKTLCTTNCSWAATTRMIRSLVQHLGERAPGAPPDSPWGHAFPTPGALARAGEDFYKDTARAGYRGRYLMSLASSVAAGELDLEALEARDLPDDEVERRLLALPGVGPYAAAHVMMLLGRYSRLILDSWTRPTYARLSGHAATDAEIEARFARYGPYRGLAFWLYLTRGWLDEPDEAYENEM